MTLQELRVNSYLYLNFSDNERNYKDIARKNLDVLNNRDSKRLMKFLNDWKCRQFKITDHNEARAALRNWYRQNESQLPSINRKLINISDKHICSFESLFEDLKESFASSTRSAE